ncbi:MAG: CCA tRNA nucleotidyltransferase [Phycisphaerae bacterium]|nr:CCA tRNA nucleotidyltransferase [Phycisphaerae bacterium]
MTGKPEQPNDPDRQRQAAVQIVRRLVEAGHVAYFAGGCVRDQIMGRVPTDYDVATDAPPQAVLALFRRSRAVGEAFGVVMVGQSQTWVEVATFRTEGVYSDGRHPDQVRFSDAEHDASRRDFTINGLFMDPLEDRLIDFVGGQADIDAGVVRAIGDPDRRFAEDYLRMLRAVRFAAKLGFSIEPQTSRAIREHAHQLGQISRERIGMELRMMLEHAHRSQAAALAQDLELDAPVLGEAHACPPLKVLGHLPPVVAYPAALAAWALDRHLDGEEGIGAAKLAVAAGRVKAVQVARNWRQALVLSNEQREGMRDLLGHLAEAINWFDLDTARRKRLLSGSWWPALEQLLEAVLKSRACTDFDLDNFAKQRDQLLAEGVAPEPLIGGHDLLAQGMRPGPAFKRILYDVYDAQLRGEVNSAAAALRLAQEMDEGSPASESGSGD